MSSPWFARVLGLGLFAAPLVFIGVRHRRADDALFLPGPTSSGHHQIETRCTECHVPLEGVSQKACLRCHGDSLTSRNDSHAPAKFDDPGKAGQLALVDAGSCLTCHREHRSEARVRGSVTVAANFCVTCHASIASERPSHATFAADGCATAGCHNYHDNRSLYRELLVRHRSDPELRAGGRLPAQEPHQDPAPLPDLPATDEPRLEMARAEWAASAHGHAAVNCQGCHGAAAVDPSARWRVADTVCASCHGDQRMGFLAGKHGMRPAVGLSAMAPGLARAPMKGEAATRTLGCTSCHGPHRFDRAPAAVSACESCHDDAHTRGYRQSPHFGTWERELRGEGAPGSGVSCASCHLPRRVVRVKGADLVRVQHNQNGNLRPTDRMSEVCLPCHGLGFSLAALADSALVQTNFRGRPAAIATGMDLVIKEESDGKRR